MSLSGMERKKKHVESRHREYPRDGIVSRNGNRCVAAFPSLEWHPMRARRFVSSPILIWAAALVATGAMTMML